MTGAYQDAQILKMMAVLNKVCGYHPGGSQFSLFARATGLYLNP